MEPKEVENKQLKESMSQMAEELRREKERGKWMASFLGNCSVPMEVKSNYVC
jgi:hypothetical protein